MKRNVIFLDFDGVLVTEKSYYQGSRRGYVLNPERHAVDTTAVRNLNSIVAATNAQIVISSAWRMCRDKDELLVLLRQWSIQGEFIGTTPIMLSGSRGQEIAVWIKRNQKSIQNYVILDDDPRTAPVKHRHVQTREKVGLTAADAAKAIAMLGGKTGPVASTLNAEDAFLAVDPLPGIIGLRTARASHATSG